MTRPRLVLPALAALLACLLVTPFALQGEVTDRSSPMPSSPSARARVDAVAALHSWDRARAGAWRRGDVARLGRLYAPGADAGRVDRRLLSSYVRRGLRVTGMHMQVARARVVEERSHRIELMVTDRLVGAVAIGRGTRVSLPRDGWSRRRVVLVRVPRPGSPWRVAAVTDPDLT